jgi:phage host-nuclease inhibitor protein Gam
MKSKKLQFKRGENKCMAKEKRMVVYRNWDEVNMALKEIGDIDRKVMAIESDMNIKINEIKATADKDASSLVERKKTLEVNIEDYTKSCVEEFKDSKSKEFLYGTVGFRKVTSIITRNIKAIIEALKQNKMNDCIVITEKLNKDELEKYDDASLKKVGAKRKVDDNFFYKLDIERIDE